MLQIAAIQIQIQEYTGPLSEVDDAVIIAPIAPGGLILYPNLVTID